MGEDFMGKCRLLALSSVRGNPMWKVNKKMMLFYVKALDMTLHDPRLWLGKVSITVCEENHVCTCVLRWCL